MTPSKPHYYSQFKTALGTFSVAVDAKGALAATAFGDRGALARRLGSPSLVEGSARTAEARRQIQAWLKGTRRDFTLRLSPNGSPFQKRVWSALRRIPYGQTRSYGAIARAMGSSARAVGRANATNPICVVIPCHRVIGADGKPTGYAFGVATKNNLLRLERTGVSVPWPRARRTQRP
jgi:methylated-DNA-[protein]-cysteine S-methyltransferase